MTIGQKIIFSSTLVAFLAALAAFMGWNNTQPIQKSLVENLTHTTEEIRFLEDIKNNVTEIDREIQRMVETIKNDKIVALARYQNKGKLLEIRIKTLAVQIQSFDEFNKTNESQKVIKEMLGFCESLSIKVEALYSKNNAFPERSIVIRTGTNTQAVVNDLEALIKEASNLRFALIKKEGTAVQTQISKLNFWIILIGGLTFLMAIVFGRVIAKNLSSEIDKLRKAAKQINKGDYSARVGLNSNDEFGKLGQTFDGMAANLQQSKTIEDQKMEMERLNEELKTKNDSLDRFVYRVSHDLKAPVVNIKSLLKLIKLKMADIEKPEVTQSFFFIEKSTDKLQQTIFDLLEVSRIERSLQSPAEWVNLEEALSKIKAESSEQILNNAVTITSDFKVNEINFAPENLDSALSNLISNAIKYCSIHRKPEIHLETERQEDFVCLRIRDNGVGIDLERHREKLFGMFNRFHNHVEGSGVGLYIVKKIIEESGGRIEVESRVGEGTTFSLFFKQKKMATNLVVEV